MKTAADWDARYAVPDYVFGTEPNEFLAAVAHEIPPGPVLCLAAGEGRDAVHLAGRGYDVTAVDFSAVGLAKARQLAADRGVTIRTIHADLAGYAIEPNRWSGIVAIFAHLPPEVRRPLYRAAAVGLVSDGVFVLEAYGPGQLAHGSGGPREPELLAGAAALQQELVGLQWLIAREIERDVNEGCRHRGRAAVVQLLGRKPRP